MFHVVQLWKAPPFREGSITVRVCISPRPWPFRWGPFGRSATRDFLIDEGRILIFQREGRSMNQSPVVVECYSSKDGCATTMDFRGSSRFKRKTEI